MAFIDYENNEAANKALKYMDGGQIDGQEVMVTLVQPRINRGGPGRGGPDRFHHRRNEDRRSPYRRRPSPQRRSPPHRRRSPSPRHRRRSPSPQRKRRGSVDSGSSSD